MGSLSDFIATLKSQYVTPIVTGLRRSQEALQTRTANRLAQDALGSIREAAEDVNVTESEILALWTDAQPALTDWYNELLEDANAIENASERAEAIAALGSLPNFISALKSQYVTPVISSIRSSAESLETRTANRLANDALGSIREAASDTNITEEEIVRLWQTAIPLIETWYQELLEDANAIENASERTEAIAALGSPEAFIANLKSQYVTPIITGIRSSAEALETRTANRIAQDALNGLRELADDVNVTEQAITAAWTAALPLINDWYQELLDDAKAIENDAERAEAIAALGSPEAFVANLKSQYVTPVLTGITQSTEALQTRTANREAQGAIQALRDVADDVNLTEQTILDKWKEAIPFIQNWWQELNDDIVNNASLSDAEITEALAELGSVEQFVGNIRSQYVTPVLNRIFQTRFSRRSGLAQNQVNRAQFSLGGATSESNFETRRDLLIDAINAYYDAEEKRINNLEASEAELRDLREDNQLAREQALRSAESATNQFAEERIRAEMQVQEQIADLRDEALEVEENRLEKIADLQERHNEKILELEEKLQDDILELRRDRAESAADIELEFQRDLEDLRTRIARDLFGDDVISLGDLTEDQRGQVEASTDFQRRLFDLEQERNRERQDLNTDFGVLRPESTGAFEYYRQALQRGELSEQEILSVFGRQGLDRHTQFDQATTDADEDLTADTADVNAEAEAQATALTEALTPLLTQQKATADTAATTAEIESTTADTAATTAEIAATTADTAATTAEIESITVGILEKTLNDFAETLPVFKLGSADLKAGAAALQNIDPLISAIADIPRRISGLSRTLDSLPERLERALSESFSELNSLVETTVSVENLNVASELSGPEPDTRLFHFPQTDAIARSVARQDALRRTREPQNYFPSRDQIRNAHDISREIVAGIQEAQRAGGNTLGDKKIEITIQPSEIVLKDEVVGRSIDETLVELDQDGRTIGSYQRPAR